MPSSDQFQ